MKIVHSFQDFKEEKNIEKEAGFILTNKKGSYVFLNDKPDSRYQGFFFFDGIKMFKIIEDIKLLDSSPIIKIKNNFFSVERARENVDESFFMPSNFNSLVYGLSEEKEIELFLDIRESYDSRIWGKNYDISHERDCIVIKFTKKTDEKEDPTQCIEEYSLYLVIKTENNNFNKVEKWINHSYDLDKKRNSGITSRDIFSALRIKAKKFVFSVSYNKEEAINESSYLFTSSESLKEFHKDHLKEVVEKNNAVRKIEDNKIKISYLSSVNSLENLATTQGILAGLPWFFQVWARDELISLKSLMFMKKRDLAEEIIEKQVYNIKEDSTLPSQKGSNLSSVDSIGWLFKRIEDFEDHPSEYLVNKLKKAVDGLVTKHTKNNFATNNSGETWMDSTSRSGIRLEIQALRLFTYHLMYKLTNEKAYKYLEARLKDKVIEKFWKNQYLYDGIDDPAIRCNIFLAYYLYPQLLPQEKWEDCFDIALDALWLDWGGISTLDKKDHLFCNIHTGEDSKSYHHGDSWYWVNNLTALVLHRFNKKKYKNYINKIIKASTREILWHGAISHHAEISSASSLKSEGCLMQAWSSAMFIELINEVYG